MPNNIKFYFLIALLSISISDFQAQTKQEELNVLKGLKIAGPGDIKPGTPMQLDPISTPIYDEQLKKINSEDLMKIMMSNEFIPEPYLDEKKNVKAFVIRKATAEEKEMMAKMQRGEMEMEQEKSKLLGTKAIDFRLSDLNAKNYNLSELRGKVVVLNFWFIACQPCIMEMPELNELVDEYKNKDVVFLAIALNSAKELKKFLKKNKFNYSIIADGQATAQTYQIKGYPTNLIIDKSGVIQYVSTGVGPNNKANLEKEIEGLLIK